MPALPCEPMRDLLQQLGHPARTDSCKLPRVKTKRIYIGHRKPSGGTAVIVDHGAPLPPRLDLRQHGTEGLEWGYGEGGPAQLALALLADYLGDDERAISLYQHLKRRLVWKLPVSGWTLTGAQLEAEVKEIEAQTARERLNDLLGVVMKVDCGGCNKKKTFWAHDRQALLELFDESGWKEEIDKNGELHFRCPGCMDRL